MEEIEQIFSYFYTLIFLTLTNQFFMFFAAATKTR